MQCTSRFAQQRAVRCIPYQYMLERVGRMRGHAPSKQQTGLDETVQRRSQLRLRLAHHRGEQGINSRPIAAAICANSLAGPPSRSSRATVLMVFENAHWV